MTANQAVPAPEQDLLARLRSLPAANVGDAQERLNVMEPEISAMWRGARVVGPAFTVLTAGGDNAAIHQALEEASAGDVLVIDGQAATHRALIGELIAGRARAKGIAGFVIDGAVRDVHDLEELGFPVWARATTPAGPYRNGPGYLQRDVSVGRVVVHPGDVIVADDDGVVVVRHQDLAVTTEAAEAKYAQESGQRDAIVSPA
ncbi:RraA family protein [Pseudonocardia nematodicida]|uniref:Putative 4-hydroxy-4-methyl-2-oxoglutarate aldolase n=1 Tax=Pseudonocardia nematodicida TaxID=1206997 RepID=A0ABV1KHF0_9PSEU